MQASHWKQQLRCINGSRYSAYQFARLNFEYSKYSNELQCSFCVPDARLALFADQSGGQCESQKRISPPIEVNAQRG